MSFQSPFQNPYNQAGVILAPVSDDIQDNQNLEPPFIRKRHGNMAYVYLDSSKGQGKPNNFTVGSNAGSYIFGQKVKRFAFSSIRLANNIPNVNPYNNNLIVNIKQGANPTVNFNFNMPVGYYTTVTSFISGFTTSLNAARTLAGVGGLFVLTVDPLNPEAYNIDASAGYTFNFDNTSLMVKRGQYLANLPQDQTLTQVKGMGSVLLTYTRYIDICSYALCEFQKNNSSADGLCKPQLLFRLFETPSSVDQNGNFIAFSRDRFISRTNLAWINYNRDTSLATIDIKLYDEFGNDLYIEEYADRPTDFYIEIELVTEL